MKRLIVITLTLAFLSFSCGASKDKNIHVDHSKEKDQYKKTNKKYKTTKRGGKNLGW